MRTLWPLYRLPLVFIATLLTGALTTRAELAEDYTKDIRPLMVKKCHECHNATKTKGDLNLERFENLDAIKTERELWQKVLEKVQAYEMPPKKAGELDFSQFEKLMGFLRQLPMPEKPDCDQIASDRTANFYRGYVMSRRLNRAEYNNTIRDLFGLELDLKLEQLLPADGGGGEGFDTTGDTLFTSSIHIEKYLAAAEQITQQVLPDRLQFVACEIGYREVAKSNDQIRMLQTMPHGFTHADAARAVRFRTPKNLAQPTCRLMKRCGHATT